MKTDRIFTRGNYNLEQEFDSGKSDSNPIDNPNDAHLIIEHPRSTKLTKGHEGDESVTQLSVAIPVDVMDDIAIAWCKKRQLNTNKYTLDELLKKSNLDWPLYETELVDALEETMDDIELVSVVKEREGTEEVAVDLAYDNIFDAVNHDKETVTKSKSISDENINQRNASESKGMFTDHPKKLLGAARGILEHIKANQTIDDEESLRTEIERLLNNCFIGEDDE